MHHNSHFSEDGYLTWLHIYNYIWVYIYSKILFAPKNKNNFQKVYIYSKILFAKKNKNNRKFCKLPYPAKWQHQKYLFWNSRTAGSNFLILKDNFLQYLSFWGPKNKCFESKLSSLDHSLCFKNQRKWEKKQLFWVCNFKINFHLDYSLDYIHQGPNQQFSIYEVILKMAIIDFSFFVLSRLTKKCNWKIFLYINVFFHPSYRIGFTR